MVSRTHYAEELKREKELIAKGNPFLKQELVQPETDTGVSQMPTAQNKKSYPHISKKEKSTNYFSLILTSDFEDLEMDIRGIREYKEFEANGKVRLVFKRRENHFLSEEGAEDLLLELRTHLNPDIKLAVFTRIIRWV